MRKRDKIRALVNSRLRNRSSSGQDASSQSTLSGSGLTVSSPTLLISSSLPSTLHGPGPLIICAHPKLALVASAGPSKVVHLSSQSPLSSLHQIIPPSPTAISSMLWDPDGSHLTLLQANSSKLLIHTLSPPSMDTVDLQSKDLTLLAFHPTSPLLYLSTGRQQIVTVDLSTRRRTSTSSPRLLRKSSRIMCGSMCESSPLCFGTDDGSVGFLSDASDPVSPLSPTPILSIKFIPESNIFSCLTSKCVILLDPPPKVRSTNINFPAGYGTTVAQSTEGLLLHVSFSSGYVISLDMKTQEVRHAIKILPSPSIMISSSTRAPSVAACCSSSVHYHTPSSHHSLSLPSALEVCVTPYCVLASTSTGHLHALTPASVRISNLARIMESIGDGLANFPSRLPALIFIILASSIALIIHTLGN